MKALLFLATSFINTFGITQPSPEAAERTARVIATMIGLVILCMLGVGAVALYILARQ